MLVLRFLCVLLAFVMILQPTWSYREISGLLDEAHELSHQELGALRPLFDELQLQYDFVISQTAINSTANDDETFKRIYENTLRDLELQLDKMFPQEANTLYDTTLPSVENILGKLDFNSMSKEQQMEFLDLQLILQETIDEAQINLNDLVKRALIIESNLLKLNKPKIVMLIFNALKIGYKAAASVGRAAYCTYSYIPQLNTSLHSLYDGVECYLYTTSLIVRIQNETYQTIKNVRKNLFELAAVYKKIVEKNSLVGKIVTAILNVTKIARNIFDTIATAKQVINDVENQLPSAAKEVKSCGSNFVVQIPHMIETVSNVTQCILFVDDTETEYDFMKPEEEYTKAVQQIPILKKNEKNDDEIDEGDSK